MKLQWENSVFPPPCPTKVVVGKWNAREMESLNYFLWVYPVCQLCDKAPGQMPKLKIVKICLKDYGSVETEQAICLYLEIQFSRFLQDNQVNSTKESSNLFANGKEQPSRNILFLKC